MITFYTTLAWIFGVGSALLFILRIVAFVNYDEHMQLRDRIDGIDRSFPVFWPLVSMVVCFTWILTA